MLMTLLYFETTLQVLRRSYQLVDCASAVSDINFGRHISNVCFVLCLAISGESF